MSTKKRDLTVVSDSELGTARNCMALWGFRYAEGLRPKSTPKYLLEGRVAHAGFAAGYEAFHTGDLEQVKAAARAAAEREYQDHLRTRIPKAGADPDLLEQLAQEAEETLELERWMVEYVFEATKADIGRRVPLLIEHPFEFRVPDRAGRRGFILVRGRLDLVMYDRAAEALEVHEHKSLRGDVRDVDRRLEMDPQSATYLHALREMLREGSMGALLWKHGIREVGAEPSAVVYNVIRKRVPSAPKLNKDGTVSVAAIDTLPQLYEAALAEQGTPDWLEKARAIASPTPSQAKTIAAAEERWQQLQAKQAELLTRLQTRADPFFYRAEYSRTPEEMERWREETWVDGVRVRNAHADPRMRTRNPGHCTMPWSMPCQYVDVCLRPEDGTIRAAHFTTREEREKARAEKETSTIDPGIGF